MAFELGFEGWVDFKRWEGEGRGGHLRKKSRICIGVFMEQL